MILAATTQPAQSAAGTIGAIFLIIIGVGLYWLPTIIGYIRHLPHMGPTVIMNLFAFAVVPWWLALMAVVRTQPRPQYLYAPPPQPGQYGDQYGRQIPPQSYGFQPPAARREGEQP